jgi:hypothetical protein
VVAFGAFAAFFWGVAASSQEKNPPPSIVTQDGMRIVSAKDKAITVVDAVTQREIIRIQGHTGVIRALALSADGKLLASGGMDKTICLWDLATGRELRRWNVPAAVEALDIAADGKTITARQSDQTMRDFDLATGQELRVYKKDEKKK